jgi:uncharacterized protein YecT (DUF1311 family)
MLRIMTIRRMLASVALAVGLAGHPLSAQTQLELNEAARRSFDAADARLMNVYKQILGDYRTDAVFVRHLRAAQRAWLAFRDAHVKALFPNQNPGRAYGSVYPVCRFRVLTELTDARSEQLEAWTKGVDETDTCAGSRKPATPRVRSATPSGRCGPPRRSPSSPSGLSAPPRPASAARDR